MSKKNGLNADTETILMALDQISQTIDVMTSVVGRLRTHVREQLPEKDSLQLTEGAEDLHSDRIIH